MQRGTSISLHPMAIWILIPLLTYSKTFYVSCRKVFLLVSSIQASPMCFPEQQVVQLSRPVATLPSANYNLLRALVAHLAVIVEHAALNKVTMRRIGIVLGPMLGIIAKLLSLMMEKLKRIFGGAILNHESDSSGRTGHLVANQKSLLHSEGELTRTVGMSSIVSYCNLVPLFICRKAISPQQGPKSGQWYWISMNVFRLIR
ncbi:hypothetical protein C8J56DRAFT_508120 [Mycena floridula]|nr:hypothetical protein C8J56DRAFT_508120 [Mycena floridula]